jgi:glycosyltransferase involved in cell wall biosynthesis
MIKMNRPIRITHVITDLDTGGAEMMLYRLLSRLDKNKVLSNVVSLTDEGPIGPLISRLGIEVRSLGMNAGNINPHGIIKLASLLKDNQTDLVQTWMYHSDFIGSLSALAAGIKPVIWGIHNSTLDPRKSKTSTRLIVRINSLLSRFIPHTIIACSQAAMNVHLRIGYDKKRMRFIPNGFDLSEFRPDESAKSRVRKELGISQHSLVVGMAARFDPQKDHQNFFSAGSIVLKHFPDLHLVLCGDGITKDNADLMKLVSPLNSDNRIHLLGRRTDMPAVIVSWDLAVLSSEYGEAFPLVLGEAMACGVPCVATDVGDSAAIIANTGLVVPPRDPQKLADAIINLLERPVGERETLGNAARERIQSNYDLKAVVEAYTRIYQEVFK